MKIIAVDDEKIALQGLLASIRKAAPDAEIYGFRNTGEAIAHMEKDPCDSFSYRTRRVKNEDPINSYSQL